VLLLDLPDTWSGRIVGGSNAVEGQFPYQVSLRTAANGHFCGGFIINNRWVGSAAHCTINRSLAATNVIVGTINRITGGINHPSSRIINHPEYASSSLRNDVSLVQTATPIVFTANVQAIPLASAHTGGGANSIASGWGQTTHPGSAPTILQHITVNTLTNADCQSRLGLLNAARIFDSTICTFTRVDEGMCMGDSGGPLVSGKKILKNTSPLPPHLKNQ